MPVAQDSPCLSPDLPAPEVSFWLMPLRNLGTRVSNQSGNPKRRSR